MRHSNATLGNLAFVLALCVTWAFPSSLYADTPFTVPPGRAAYPLLMTVGPDHNLWFAETGGLKIGRITPAGVITEFPIAGAQSVVGITSGPDGNIWFTDQFAGFVGRINTSGGGLMTYPLAPNSHPQGITAGPDGKLWFVDNADTGAIGTGFGIGQITTAGQLHEYYTHVDSGIFDAEDYTPANITVGPDGNLWFTNSLVGAHGKNIVGKITTGGTITIYSTGDTPVAITSGPDGNLWVTENAHVAKISTSGAESECAALRGGGYDGIATGPDGNIWFTELQRAGYVVPSTCTLTELPKSSFPGFLYLSGMTSAPDGALWFLGFGSSNIGRLNTAGQVTNTYALNAGSTPDWDIQGPDGAVWFSAPAANEVGRIDVNGVITHCPTAPGAMPGEIITGPDGHLWFTEGGTFKIATMPTTGCTITEYLVGDGATNPGLVSIANGPDGNMWFTEWAAAYNNIVRITTSGVMTAYPIPTPGASAFYETAGPDGNVWFTEYSGHNIGKINPTTHQITEYPYPGIGKPPAAIVTGPDNNLWIMINTAFGAIGKFSTDGTLLAEYPAQFQTSLLDIRVGSDGALWYPQYYPNGVGRITTSGVVSTVALTSPNAASNDVVAGSDGKLWVAEVAAGAIGRMSAIGGTGNTITATHGSPFNGAVASFVDGTPVARQADFTAQVDWGDGTRSAGTVSGNMGGPFTVTGNHTYVTSGTFNLTVTLHDNVDNAMYTASRGVAHVR